MAVVTSAWSFTANQVWASPTWSTDDPSYKLNTELSNWITAVNDTSKIEMIFNPGNATSRTESQVVGWLLRARDGDTSNGDYGIIFFPRYAGSSFNAGSGDMYAGVYRNRSESTSNNGAGTFNSIYNSQAYSSFTSPGSCFTAYEATGELPWFCFSTIKGGDGTAATHIIARLSTSAMTAGSYYPSSGLAKWLYITSYQGASSYGSIFTPQSRFTAPFIGIPANRGSAGFTENLFRAPRSTYGDGYFFGFPGVYGDTHYLGKPSSDFLISNSVTGSWGDTVTFSGTTYTSVRFSDVNFWVRTS